MKGWKRALSQLHGEGETIDLYANGRTTYWYGRHRTLFDHGESRLLSVMQERPEDERFITGKKVG